MNPPVFGAAIERNSREEVRVALEGVGNRFVLDVRVWQDAKYGSVCNRSPTKHGATLDARHIPAMIAALKGAEAEAIRLGLIGGDQ